MFTVYMYVQAVSLSLSSVGSVKPAATGVTPASRGPIASTTPTSIPLSPPIPTVSVTPSPAKTPIQQSSTHSHTSTPSTVTSTGGAASHSPRPKKTGSLALFYRKVYLMAHLRIKDLCERLEQSQDFQQK